MGYTSVKTVDEEKRIGNHPFITSKNKGPYTDPLVDEDFSTYPLFYFNTFLGPQLPLDLGKFYLVPAAHIAFGGMLGISDWKGFYYGPKLNLDLGIKMKYGSILFVGTGYSYYSMIKSEEDKTWIYAPNYQPFPNFGSLQFRIGYKF